MMRVPVVLPGLLLLLAACGGPRGDDPQRSAQAVFDASMAAVAAADLDALWPLLTEPARAGVEKQLAYWQKQFSDPDTGAFLREEIRRRLGPIGEDRFELAAKGSLRDVFRLMMEADPRPAKPKQRALVVSSDGKQVRIRYDSPSGDQVKEVEALLVQRPSGWYVASFSL
jgi:hypothetical protein